MPSTYSNLLGIELIGIGDQNNTWGVTTNTNLGTILEQAIAGTTTIDVTGGDVTLTTFDGTTNQARQAAIKVIGTPGVARNIIAPARSHIYVVSNGSNATVTVKTTTSVGIAIPVNNTYLIYFDPTVGIVDFKLVGKASATANMADTLVLRDGSGNFAAGVITATFAGPLSGNVTGDLNGNLSSASPTAATQVVTDNSTKVATTAFVRSIIPAGVIMMWSGATGTIPAGWALCDGTAGRPDLRDRFVIGAGANYIAGTVGGTADAVVVSHTHNYSGNTGGQSATHQHDSSWGENGSTPSPFGVSGRTGRGSSATDNDNQGWLTGANITDHVHAFSGTTAGANGGVSGTNANIPPYFALCYIIKL